MNTYLSHVRITGCTRNLRDFDLPLPVGAGRGSKGEGQGGGGGAGRRVNGHVHWAEKKEFISM